MQLSKGTEARGATQVHRKYIIENTHQNDEQRKRAQKTTKLEASEFFEVQRLFSIAWQQDTWEN